MQRPPRKTTQVVKKVKQTTTTKNTKTNKKAQQNKQKKPQTHTHTQGKTNKQKSCFELRGAKEVVKAALFTYAHAVTFI